MNKNNRVNEIDLLRFIAALSVVFFHYSFRGYAADGLSSMPYPLLAAYSKYGYLGVELFFMISGFVILMTAANGNIRTFIISRLTRLYPAFWACCTLTFVITILIGKPIFSASLHQYAINMTMLSKFVGVPSIDGVYWSLFVEIKFYALVVIVLLIKRIHQAQFFLILWLITSIFIEIFPIDKLRNLLIVDYSAYFIAGAIYFLIWSQGLSLARCCIIVVSWGLAIYQSLNALPDFENHFSTTISGLVVALIITIFFAIMYLISKRCTGYFGRNQWLIAGALTYPLYLTHHNIGFMVFNVAYPTVNNHMLFWGTILLMLAIAYAVNVFIERRFALPMKNALNHSFDSLHRLATDFCERVKIRR